MLSLLQDQGKKHKESTNYITYYNLNLKRKIDLKILLTDTFYTDTFYKQTNKQAN